MTDPTNRPAGGIPSTFEGWEVVLTRWYLEVGSDGDASPIKALEASPEALAMAAGHPGSAAQAVAAFKDALRGPGLVDALEQGRPPTRRIGGCPGFFAYLVLTLFVASLVDDEKGLAGDFRGRLRDFTGVDRSFNNLQGVAEMWARLVAWSDARRAEGLPFRSLVLPQIPQAWKHIGYTLRLTFPSKSDASFLTRFLHDRPGLLDDPRNFVFAMASQIERGRGSDGLKEAFRDFREAFDAGERFLADHHLWRFVASCAPRSTARTMRGAAIDLMFDQDGTALFAVVPSNGEESEGPLTPLSDAVAAIGIDAIPSLRHGFLVFHQTGFGRWRTVDRPDDGSSRVLFACRSPALSRLRDRNTAFDASGTWSITKNDVPRGVADSFGSLLGGQAMAVDSLAVVTVGGGVMADGAWLGRPPFLPRIRGGGGAMELRRGAGAEGGMSVTSDAQNPQESILAANGPVSGIWIVEPAQGRRSWSRRMTFVRNAPPRSPDGEDDRHLSDHEQILEWRDGEDRPVPIGHRPSGWIDGDPRMGDLVEALYAGGKSGWDEGRLVALAHDAMGKELDPWHVLRSLRDASYVRPHLRPLWKGRIWGLEPLTLRLLDPVLAIVDGAPCEMLMDAFRNACAVEGADPFRVPGVTPFAPMLVGCVGGDAAAVARRLGWPLRNAACCRGGRGGSLVETKLTSRHRQPASRWDWGRGRFVADGKVGDGDVTLTRWSQADGRDHDVYVVRSDAGERRFVSRTAAVLAAHQIQRLPLFAASEEGIVATIPDAALPDRLSMRLRLTHASNPGPTPGGYSYPCGTAGLRWLAGTLPGMVLAAATQHEPCGEPAARLVRHSRGRWRSMWIDGQIRSESAVLRKTEDSGDR